MGLRGHTRCKDHRFDTLRRRAEVMGPGTHWEGLRCVMGRDSVFDSLDVEPANGDK